MRVLALADKRPPIDPATMARQKHVDAVFCLGDLDRAWIESLMLLDVPRYGVHGNHDPEDVLRELEIEDMHLRRTHVAGGGLTIAGFEGCVRYRRNAPYQYTQREANKLVKRLPAADVLLCHCPPFGINDDPDDPAHIGFEGLRDWVDVHHPRHILHGHTHPLPGRTVKTHGDTRVHYVSGARILDLR
jgi:Icc-related predicted phosphoesterase